MTGSQPPMMQLQQPVVQMSLDTSKSSRESPGGKAIYASTDSRESLGGTGTSISVAACPEGDSSSPRTYNPFEDGRKRSGDSMALFDNDTADMAWKEKKRQEEDRKKLDGLIESFTKQRREERKNKPVDGHILDDYISVLTYLHKTQRFKRFFDPIRLRMHLITPQFDDDGNENIKPQV